ncbi:MAG: hypothetical protein K6E62_00255 [Lachnospiraceae bacterium]|nr:hypothetical protein [Lachnospiraceae bacterium]
MMKCPKCGKEYDRLLALSRTDNKTMICDDCGIKEALDDVGITENNPKRKEIMKAVHRASPYERTRAQVYATGNKWAIENFEATHS